MNDRDEGTAAGTQTLADLQHWTWVLGKAQQMMLEHGIHTMGDFPPSDWEQMKVPGWGDPGDFVRASADFWSDTMKLWQRFLDPATPDTRGERPEHARLDRYLRRGSPAGRVGDAGAARRRRRALGVPCLDGFAQSSRYFRR